MSYGHFRDEKTDSWRLNKCMESQFSQWQNLGAMLNVSEGQVQAPLPLNLYQETFAEVLQSVAQPPVPGTTVQWGKVRCSLGTVGTMQRPLCVLGANNRSSTLGMKVSRAQQEDGRTSSGSGHEPEDSPKQTQSLRILQVRSTTVARHQDNCWHLWALHGEHS